MSDISAVAGTTVDAPGFNRYAQPADTGTPGNELDNDAFLKLLVAQLKYQDPLEPSSSEEFIATSAQFTTIEKLTELTDQGADSALLTSLATAGSLIGKEISAVGDDGDVGGVVQRSEVTNGQVFLVTNEGSVPIDRVTSVGAAPSASTPSITSTSTTPADAANGESGN